MKEQRGMALIELTGLLLITLPLLYSILGLMDLMWYRYILADVSAEISSNIVLDPYYLHTGDQGYFLKRKFECRTETIRTYGTDFQNEWLRVSSSIQSSIHRALGCADEGCLNRYLVEARYKSVAVDKYTGAILINPGDLSQPDSSAHIENCRGEADRNIQKIGGLTGSLDLNKFVNAELLKNRGSASPFAIPTGLYGVTHKQNYGFTNAKRVAPDLYSQTEQANYLRSTFVVGIKVEIDVADSFAGHLIRTLGVNEGNTILSTATVTTPRTTL